MSRGIANKFYTDKKTGYVARVDKYVDQEEDYESLSVVFFGIEREGIWFNSKSHFRNFVDFVNSVADKENV